MKVKLLKNNRDEVMDQSSGRRRKAKFVNFASVLNKVVSQYGIDKRLREHTMLSMWPHVVGEPWSSLSRAVFFDYERNLVVAVKDSSIAQELTFKKVEILKSVRAMAKSVGVKVSGVRFDIKSYSKIKDFESFEISESASSEPYEPTEEDLIKVELSSDTKSELENFKKSLDDESTSSEVKSRIFEIYERDLRRTVWLIENGAGICSGCGIPSPRLYGARSLCSNCFVAQISEAKFK